MIGTVTTWLRGGGDVPAQSRAQPAPDFRGFAELPEYGDIMAIAGRGWLSRSIMRLTNASDVAESDRVSHVGALIATDPPVVLEALTRVRTNPLRKSIADCERAWLLKPYTLSREQRMRISERAMLYSADSYDYLKIVLQLIDAIAGKIARRRMTWMMDHVGRLSNRPICSYELGMAFACEGLNFGVSARSTTPGDIFLFAKRNPDKYRVIRLK